MTRIPFSRVRAVWQSFLDLRAPADVVARMIIWMFAIYSVWQGVGICVAGPARWDDVSYSVIRDIPGAPYTWGVSLAVIGVVLAWSSWRGSWGWKLAALLGFVLWSVSFSFGAFVATQRLDEAGATAGPTYLLMAAVAAALIMIDERPGVGGPGAPP